MVDRNTGDMWIQARDGTMYSPDELEAIEARAAAGDATAIARMESLDATGITPAQMLHDCPECRAAMALGEVPEIMGPQEIAALHEAARRDPVMRALLAEAGLDDASRDAMLDGRPGPRTTERPRTGRPVMRRRPFRRRHR